MYVCVYTRMSVCVCICICICSCMCIFICICFCTCIDACKYIYIYTCAHELPQMERLIIASIFAILPPMFDNIKRGRIVRLSDLSNHM